MNIKILWTLEGVGGSSEPNEPPLDPPLLITRSHGIVTSVVKAIIEVNGRGQITAFTKLTPILTKYYTRDYVHICPYATFGKDRTRGYFVTATADVSGCSV